MKDKAEAEKDRKITKGVEGRKIMTRGGKTGASINETSLTCYPAQLQSMMSFSKSKRGGMEAGREEEAEW